MCSALVTSENLYPSGSGTGFHMLDFLLPSGLVRNDDPNNMNHFLPIFQKANKIECRASSCFILNSKIQMFYQSTLLGTLFHTDTFQEEGCGGARDTGKL